MGVRRGSEEGWHNRGCSGVGKRVPIRHLNGMVLGKEEKMHEDIMRLGLSVLWQTLTDM